VLVAAVVQLQLVQVVLEVHPIFHLQVVEVGVALTQPILELLN
jgi:hypothetical protein